MSLDTLSTEPPTLTDTETPATPDPRIARAEERLCMLRELAEMGMELTRALVRQNAPAPEAPEGVDMAPASPAPTGAPAARRDPADAFARLSRAIRLTLALEATTDEAIAALRAGGSPVAGPAGAAPAPAGGPAWTPMTENARLGAYREAFRNDLAHEGVEAPVANAGPPPRDYPSAFRNRVRDCVIDVINREIDSGHQAIELLDETYERLWEGERYDAFIFRPLKEAVAAICDDLGLKPDWSRWAGEGWPPPESSSRRWDTGWRPIGDMTPK
jgi:hypothetical protein